MLSAPDRAEQYRVAAQRRIDEEFHWDRIAERSIEMYREVLTA